MMLKKVRDLLKVNLFSIEKYEEILSFLLTAVGISPHEPATINTFGKIVENIDKKKTSHFKTAFSYLAQFVYLPHIYGYSSISGKKQSETCTYLKEELGIFKEGILNSKAAIQYQNMVKYIHEISKFINYSSCRESKFLQLKMNEFIDVCVNDKVNFELKEQIQNEIVKFSLKIKAVTFSPNLRNYQKIVMDQAIMHYEY